MKKRSFVLSAALVLSLVLAGCSAGREGNTLEPSHSVTGSDSGVYETNDGNDAFEGGGAGGTNDRDNDGRPDIGAGSGVDDIDRDADNAIHDAGDAIGDAVDDVGDAVGDVGRAIR